MEIPCFSIAHGKFQWEKTSNSTGNRDRSQDETGWSTQLEAHELQNHGDLSKWSIPQKTWILLIYDQYDSTSFNKVSRNHTRWWLTNPSEITWNHRFQPVSSTMLRTWNHPPRPISVLPLFRLKPTRDATVFDGEELLGFLQWGTGYPRW